MNQQLNVSEGKGKYEEYEMNELNVNVSVCKGEEGSWQQQQWQPVPTPHYRRLTFISVNACDFCTHVTNPGPYMHYLSYETKNGWVSCGDESCKTRGKQAVEAFMETEAYGRANHLKNRESINVKRTSGQMDSDWLLERSYPEVQVDYNGVEKVCVTKPSALIEKWVSIDNLLSWNSSS